MKRKTEAPLRLPPIEPEEFKVWLRDDKESLLGKFAEAVTKRLPMEALTMFIATDAGNWQHLLPPEMRNDTERRMIWYRITFIRIADQPRFGGVILHNGRPAFMFEVEHWAAHDTPSTIVIRNYETRVYISVQ